jgi:pantoate--beta-alanine ligase
VRTVTTVADLRGIVRTARRQGATVGLVPTMGAFHDGHVSLMRRARAENDLVVVWLFVNPTQFNDLEDYARYPRDTARDTSMADAAGVDILFTPGADAVYPPGFATSVSVRGLAEPLEGASRPGHFDGVALVVAKLLNMVQADRAYFGEKDWQQLLIVRRLAADLDIPTEIIACPIVREEDGLAMSSRNVRLSPEERAAAAVLSRALDSAQALAASGVADPAALAARLSETIAAQPLARIDYAVVVDPETLLPIETIESKALAAVAVTFGNVRLIDNRLLHPSGSSTS